MLSMQGRLSRAATRYNVRYCGLQIISRRILRNTASKTLKHHCDTQFSGASYSQLFLTILFYFLFILFFLKQRTSYLNKIKRILHLYEKLKLKYCSCLKGQRQTHLPLSILVVYSIILVIPLWAYCKLKTASR